MPEGPLGDFTGRLPDEPVRERFQSIILDHYAREGRDLPWRGTGDPYVVLVSELMLQQTQVSRVQKKWDEFILHFPDLPSIARASLSDVLTLWRGLGYNRRAKALKQIADTLTAAGAPVPRTVSGLQELPMIGPATARSIAVFAFNSPEIFIETNIRRVFIHFFFEGRDGVSDREILPIHEAVLYRKDPGRWYNALMDYGTILGAGIPNANLRSTGYTRQSPFAGSFRQLRGAVLRELAGGPARIEDVDIPEGFTRKQTADCMRVLEREGFLVCENDGRYRIP